MVTEVMPKNARYKITDAELALEGYNMSHNLERVKFGEIGRGTLIYVAKEIECSPVPTLDNLANTSGFKDAVFSQVKLDKGDIGTSYF